MSELGPMSPKAFEHHTTLHEHKNNLHLKQTSILLHEWYPSLSILQNFPPDPKKKRHIVGPPCA